MKIIVAHPTGNPNVRALLAAFNDAGLLTAFCTTIAVDPAHLLIKLLPWKIQKELTRRSYAIPLNQIRTRPLLELFRHLLPKLGFKQSVSPETGFASLESVYADLDRMVAARLKRWKEVDRVKAVYAYEDGALHTFMRAKELGLTCIYDLPIAYWETGRRLMLEEAERLPAWAQTLGGGISDSAKKLDRKRRELELADIVVVPGEFVHGSLPEWAKGKKIIVSPFGSPDNEQFQQAKSFDRPLRVLFVGSMGQRKGLADLFKAMKMMLPGQAELVVMGPLQAPLNFYKAELPDFIYESSRPHGEVLKLMQTCDVLCLPSIVEGRALVMQEAMSQGLPLLITANTGGEDLIAEGHTGFLIPIRSPQKIAEKLKWFSDNREKTKQMGAQARKAAAGYTWKKYGDHIVNEIGNYDV
jgi:glycosyltransferase involved in cell wall biosynthesis